MSPGPDAWSARRAHRRGVAPYLPDLLAGGIFVAARPGASRSAARGTTWARRCGWGRATCRWCSAGSSAVLGLVIVAQAFLGVRAGPSAGRSASRSPGVPVGAAPGRGAVLRRRPSAASGWRRPSSSRRSSPRLPATAPAWCGRSSSPPGSPCSAGRLRRRLCSCGCRCSAPGWGADGDGPLANLALGFETALQPDNSSICFVGVLLGTLVGVLPGIGPTATVAMLLPITFNFEPVAALIMLAGIYYGAQYGGSTTAILINLPGRVVGRGHRARRPPDGPQGRAGPALATAALGSFFAGTVATVVLALFAPPLAERRAEVRAGRVLRARRARPDRLDRAGQRLDPQGAGDDRPRAPARHGRPGHLHRHAAVHVRLRASCTAASTSSRSRSACSAWPRSCATSSTRDARA